ncbi:hypothetical protein [Streptomyces sp. NPDC059761]|uniref:hypothetical protein n=1 Tax=Streptomyces sp. NPDC059761 TaxID=3346937 RepID=UPI003665DEC5
MNDRPRPRTIRPRALKRATAFDGYITSDGRYEARPARFGTDGRVRFWNVTDLRNPPADGKPAHYTDLKQIRTQLCAPNNKVPWLVCDMDQGVLRVGLTRNEVVSWAAIHFDAGTYRFEAGSSCYEYFFEDGDGGTSVFVVKADSAHLHGFNPEQQPLFPFPDDPYEEVARPEPARTEAL